MPGTNQVGGAGYVTRLALLACCVVMGCAGRYIRIEQQGLTCVEAHQIAITAVQRLGYTIEQVQKPAPSAPGFITGAHEEGANKQTIFVQVFCTTLGAEVEAKAEGGGLGQLNFPSEFRRSFEVAAATRAPVRKAAESGVDVLLTPERVNSSDLGVDLTPTGSLPVSVRITNSTNRNYRFRTKDVVLQTAEGERVKPLSPKDVATKLDSAAAATIQKKAVTDRDIKANETLNGYLFFPFKSYSHARVVLKDLESGEPEGFSIEF